MANESYKLRGRNALIIGTPYDFFIIRLLGHILMREINPYDARGIICKIYTVAFVSH